MSKSTDKAKSELTTKLGKRKRDEEEMSDELNSPVKKTHSNSGIHH